MTTMLYRRCHFCGTVWTIVYVNNGHANLTSLYGRQFKRNVALSEIQVIDEFADAYPEE